MPERFGANRASTGVTMASVNGGHHPDLSGRDGGAALTRLYDDHAEDLHRYLARRLDPATADDLVAETFLTAWQQRHRYRPDLGSARAWLFGIATNLLRRHARAEARAWHALARDGGRRRTDTDGPDTVAARRVDADAQAQRLAEALAGLRAEERDVLLLVAWAGLQPVEVVRGRPRPPAHDDRRNTGGRRRSRGTRTRPETSPRRRPTSR
jgi:RNA polymerase sigma-70 factor (ECF subfamily)